MAELQKHADASQLSVAQIVMANEVAVSGKSEAEINAFIDKIHDAMVNIVKAGLKRRRARCQVPSSSKPRPVRSTSERWTINSSVSAELASCRRMPLRDRKRTRVAISS